MSPERLRSPLPTFASKKLKASTRPAPELAAACLGSDQLLRLGLVTQTSTMVGGGAGTTELSSARPAFRVEDYSVRPLSDSSCGLGPPAVGLGLRA